MPERTHYEILGVALHASASDVTARYKAALADARAKLASGSVDPDWLTGVREAYAVLSDPKKRAAYDQLMAAQDAVAAPVARRSNFFARAWRGELCAWQPFWLMLLPAWLVTQGLLLTWVGLLLLALLGAFVPLPVLLALGALLLLVVLAGAVLLWRSAFNVAWRPMGYLGRACAVAMVAALGLPVYQAAAGKGELGALARLAVPGASGVKEVPKERRLLGAAHKGDFALVKKLLDAGESPHVREAEGPDEGRTPLHYAAGGTYYNPSGRHLEVAELLVARGADVNAEGRTGYTPLHVASGLGQVKMAELLLNKGADINAKDARGTPLQAAVLQGHEPVVALLIERKADLKGSLAVMGQMAAYKPAHTVILTRLLDAGADPNERTPYGTPFDAVVTRSEEAAILLISRGAALGPDKPGLPPRAFRLAEYDRIRALKLAFEKGLDPTTRAADGRTLMHVARTPEVVDLLISKGLSIDDADGKGGQPLHHAVQRGDRELVAHLIAKGAAVNAADAAGMTPLMFARAGVSDKEKGSPADLLLESGADLTLRNKVGYAALDVAAEHRDLKMLQRLLEKGASAAARDTSGYTALHRARSRQVAEALLAAGASAKAVARDGKTPLHLAAQNYEDVTDVLLKHGADINAVDQAGQTPLFAAVRHERIASRLIEAGAEVLHTDAEGKTPLHYAAASNVASVKLLVAKGAPIGAKDKSGNTPLHAAARRNNPYFVKALIDLGADPQAKNRDGKMPADVAADAARAQMQKTLAQPAAKAR